MYIRTHLDVCVLDNFLELVPQVVHAVEEFAGLWVDVLPPPCAHKRHGLGSVRGVPIVIALTADVLVHEDWCVQRERLMVMGRFGSEIFTV